MYGFPLDLDLKNIVGCDLNLMGMGRYDVQLCFDGSGINMAIQGNINLLENSKVIATWNEENNWSSLNFQKVLNATVESYAVVSENMLEIRFDKGLTLQIVDSEQYESMQIYFDDKTKPTIIV